MTGTDELRLRTSETDQLGFTHNRYDQFYKGVPVESGAYGVHIRNGLIEKTNGSFQKITNVDVIPTLSEEKALQQALNSFANTTFAWKVPAQEKFIKQVKNDLNASFYPKGTLLIYKDLLNEKSILSRLQI